ncbi:hypothetical protein BO94DRAFT_534915 [Aspergillus sclerotioniger CBS 115572]|uniref:Uncharacterized protein n=1 Tax=Aspergillus sclerotioniger CBS 115572 TaxID=1450535 RepID=A0A317WN90_9EURO|nr:hypothetical protein BO94DRAFT_534915 [Aspergillus sclerotioniger CBS 115572]PWY87914.1 hypothetical protein BO94DRAFT_534915 [Aspergillus sclerotioniger CBS 115572]
MTTTNKPEIPVPHIDSALDWIYPFFEGPTFQAQRANTHIKVRDRFKAEGPPEVIEKIGGGPKVTYYPRVEVIGLAEYDPLLPRFVILTLLLGPFEDREMFERIFNAEVEFLKKDKNRPGTLEFVVGAWYENKLTLFKLQDGKMIGLGGEGGRLMRFLLGSIWIMSTRNCWRGTLSLLRGISLMRPQ